MFDFCGNVCDKFAILTSYSFVAGIFRLLPEIGTLFRRWKIKMDVEGNVT